MKKEKREKPSVSNKEKKAPKKQDMNFLGKEEKM